MPREAEIWSLIALMEFQSSRFAARIDAEGLPLTLEQQDRRRWDRSAIARGNEAMAQAARDAGIPAGPGATGPAVGRGIGYYGLQAAIAQCHAVAPTFAETDWRRILGLYDALDALAPSAVVRLNRAVALSMAEGPEQALVEVESLQTELPSFRPLPAVRAELLERLGDTDAAAAAFLEAAALPGNDAETALLRRRAAQAASSAPRRTLPHR
jgi:predicted RNA polymerase sigma factor